MFLFSLSLPAHVSLIIFLILVGFLQFIVNSSCTKGQPAAVQAVCTPGPLADYATNGFEGSLPGKSAKEPQARIPSPV